MPIRLAFVFVLVACAARGDTLEGRVVEDHSGNPLASVELKVHRVGVRQLAAHLETDASGQFSAEGLSPGEYRIEATKANFLGATLRLSGVSSGLVIRLVRCGVISGRIVDGQGMAVPGAAVYALPKPAGGGAWLRPSGEYSVRNFAEANNDGQYRLHNLLPGEYAVAATYGSSAYSFGRGGGGAARPGLGSGVQIYPSSARPNYFAVNGGEEYRNIDFTVMGGPLASISGKLELPEAKTRYWLALSPADQPALAAAVASTKEDGSFQFEGIAPGAYQLTAAGPVRGYGGAAILGEAPYFGRTQVSVGSGNVEGTAVTLRKGRTVAFILGPQRPETCPASAQMTLAPLEDWSARLTRTAELNFQKASTVDHIAPARYLVTLGRLGDACYQPETMVLDFSGGAGEATVAVKVAPAGSILGKVVGGAGGGRFAVALRSADALTSAEPVQVVFADGAGNFAFTALRPGRYRVTVQPAGGSGRAEQASVVEVRVAAGAPTAVQVQAPVAGGN